MIRGVWKAEGDTARHAIEKGTLTRTEGIVRPRRDCLVQSCLLRLGLLNDWRRFPSGLSTALNMIVGIGCLFVVVSCPNNIYGDIRLGTDLLQCALMMTL